MYYKFDRKKGLVWLYEEVDMNEYEEAKKIYFMNWANPDNFWEFFDKPSDN